MTLLPIGIACLLFGRYEHQKSKGVHSSAFNWLLVFLFFVMPAVSSTVFKVYKCQNFEDSEESWLVADFSLQCDDGVARSLWLAYTTLMVS